MLLFAVIITYILSNIIALALVFTGKKLNPGWFRMIATTHLLFGIVFLFSYFTSSGENPVYISFLIFFCTGIIAGGLALGNRAFLPVRIYFAIFCASIFLFIVSPSTLLQFLVSARFTDPDKGINVRQNYFLEKQSGIFRQDSIPMYKLIEKKGMFHKTVARNLDFHGTLDSIRVLTYDENRTVVVRGYCGQSNFVEDILDSVDVTIPLNESKPGQIERKL